MWPKASPEKVKCLKSTNHNYLLITHITQTKILKKRGLDKYALLSIIEYTMLLLLSNCIYKEHIEMFSNNSKNTGIYYLYLNMTWDNIVVI